MPDDIKPDDPRWTERWPNFSHAEMRCKGSGECRMDPEFMDVLQNLRDDSTFPFPIASGYRSPEHNNRVSSTGLDGPHTTGKAVDIRIAGENAFTLIYLAVGADRPLKFLGAIRGIGVKQNGPWSGRFIHLDTLTGEKRPRIWSY